MQSSFLTWAIETAGVPTPGVSSFWFTLYITPEWAFKECRSDHVLVPLTKLWHFPVASRIKAVPSPQNPCQQPCCSPPGLPCSVMQAHQALARPHPSLTLSHFWALTHCLLCSSSFVWWFKDPFLRNIPCLFSWLSHLLSLLSDTVSWHWSCWVMTFSQAGFRLPSFLWVFEGRNFA